jgi:hypothetical protein
MTGTKTHRGREHDREYHDYSTPANPHFAELCAMSLSMWTAGGDPQEIADWLESKQDGCVVNVSNQVHALRGLESYRSSNPFSLVAL